MRLPCLLLGLLPLAFAPTAVATPRTNVVLFFVDDLGWADNDLDAMRGFAAARGDTDAFFETPHLRALAGDGLTFDRGYASSPVCSPTRASLMLGQTPATHRVTQFIGGPNNGVNYTRGLPAAPTTLAEAFKGDGYLTGYAGKWHLGSLPTQHGYDLNNGGGRQGLPPTWYADAGGGFDWATGLPDDGPEFAGEYLTDRLTRDSIDFVNLAVANERPFLLTLSHYGVHVPFAAPLPLVEKYKAKLANGSYAQFDGLTASQRGEIATYAAMTEAVDDSLGRLRAALETAGIADETIILFTSDNGGLATPDFGNFATNDMNAPLRNGKGTLYEGGVRSTFVAAGPGVALGVSDQIVATHDVFATLSTMTGVPLPNQTNDGLDLSAQFGGAALTDRGDKPLTIHYPHFSNQGGRPGGAAFRGDWKLIQSYEHGGVELFNLQADLSETTDTESLNLRRAEGLRVDLHRALAGSNAQVPSTFTLNTEDAGAVAALANPSFEADVLPDNTSGDPSNVAARTPTGWSWVGGVELRNGGVANPNQTGLFGPDFPGTDGDGQNGAMDGPQLAYFGSTTGAAGAEVAAQLVGLEQALSEPLRAETRYTLRFAAGSRADQNFFVDGVVRLTAGGQVVAEYETPHEANGLLREYQLVWDSSDVDPSLVGQTLGVQILRDTDGGKVSYDNVRLYGKSLVPRLAGDFNGDGLVDAADYTVWRDSEGHTGIGLAADADYSSTVDAGDLAIWRASYGRAADSPTEVPEPAGVVLTLLAGAALRARPQRR